MRSRITKIGAALAALAALAVGGSTLASASSSSNAPAKASPISMSSMNCSKNFLKSTVTCSDAKNL